MERKKSVVSHETFSWTSYIRRELRITTANHQLKKTRVKIILQKIQTRSHVSLGYVKASIGVSERREYEGLLQVRRLEV
jgi:hypothetical protein